MFTVHILIEYLQTFDIAMSYRSQSLLQKILFSLQLTSTRLSFNRAVAK